MRRLALFLHVFVKLASISSGLMLIGCTVTPAEQPFRMTPTADIKPAFAIPSVRERMIYLARQEWTLFGRPVADYSSDPPVLVYPADTDIGQETQPPLLSRVILYWYTVTSLPMVGYQGELRPWSGAFIVWLARSAGVAEQDLPSSVLHWDYIEQALKASNAARFVARNARVYAPKPGDLLCAPRGETFMADVDSFERLRRGTFHCDLVVALHPGELELIGGNVLDAVSLTHVAIDAKGCALPSRERPWRVVLEQRDIE
ncbi:MAG: DUF2272 domain-containing protein [Gammaproteobacteria bacterium]